MTNIELIKILQKSIDEFGQLPVDMNIIDYDDSDKPYDIKAALYDDNSVTLFNYQNMTREEAKKLLPFIQAFSEGKTIQSKCITDEMPLWWDDNNPTFEVDGFDYRIKPEPKYRPFANAEECIEEMKKHVPFGWVKDKYSFYTIEMKDSKEYIKARNKSIKIHNRDVKFRNFIRKHK